MKIRFTIIALVLFPAWLQAQAFQIDKAPLPIDSLKKALPRLQESLRVNCLNELSRSYIEAGQFDSAMITARRAYSEASVIKYIKGLGDACIQYAMIYTWRFNDNAESEKYYREAIFWHEKIQADNELGFGYSGLGTTLLGQNADEAKRAFDKSIFHFSKSGNRTMLVNLMDNISQVYAVKGDFEKQFEYIKKALQEKKRIHDHRGLTWSYYYLAHIYQNVEDYHTALNYFRMSFQQAHSQSVRWNIYRSMGNIFLYMENYDSSLFYFRKMLERVPFDAPAMAGLGKLFMLRKEHDKALYYLQNALSRFKKTNHPGRAIWVMIDMGKNYAATKNYAAALQSARECLTIAGQTGNNPVMQFAYEIHWKVYDDLKQKDSAYFYFQKFVEVKISLDATRFKSQYLQKLALNKVETKEEQQQARIDLLNKDNQLKHKQLQKEALQKKILVGSLAALVLLSIIILRNIALKRKNEKHQRELAENELQIQKLETQKELAELETQALRCQMNPHFIFNCLSSINRFILKNESETASDYLTKFSRLIRMVLNNSKNTSIILDDELEMLRLYLDLERLRFKNSFDYSISFLNHFDVSSIFIPPLLLQPFAENAIWHGLMQKEGHGNLEIVFELENDLLNCYITDNGVGRKKAESFKSKSAEKQKSMGMQITAERLALLDKNTEQPTFNVEDLVDAEGQAAGTRVTLKIRCNERSEELHES